MAPVDRAQVAAQVADRIEAMRLTHSRQEIVLHLSPAHLGDVRLTVAGSRDGITAQIVASSQAARDAVESGREHLRAALEQRGFTLQGLDVSLQQNAPERQPAAFAGAPLLRRPVSSGTSDRSNVSDLSDATTGRQPGGLARWTVGRLDYHA